MEKKKLGIGQYTTTSTCCFEGRINHVKENMSLTNEAKSAVLEFLTESDEFHKLVCDITGTERKQVKVSQELEKLKEVECNSVRGIVDSLKAERANGKLLAEENELCRRENDKLKLNYEKANKELEAQKDLVKKYVAKSEKMRRLSISNKSLFVPEEGEIFFAEVPNKGIERKVKALVSKDENQCEKCVFCRGKLGELCWKVTCFEKDVQYTFRRVRDGEI